LLQTFGGTGDIRASYHNDAADSASVAGIQKAQGHGVLQGRSTGKEIIGVEAVTRRIDRITLDEMCR
jgi:hypothetical protein